MVWREARIRQKHRPIRRMKNPPANPESLKQEFEDWLKCRRDLITRRNELLRHWMEQEAERPDGISKIEANAIGKKIEVMNINDLPAWKKRILNARNATHDHRAREVLRVLLKKIADVSCEFGTETEVEVGTKRKTELLMQKRNPATNSQRIQINSELDKIHRLRREAQSENADQTAAETGTRDPSYKTERKRVKKRKKP